jgi:hypothetical protein
MSALTEISPANARLPQAYESAKNALTQCVALDECKDWADKAAALASYAKQANDEELMKMATRIRDRAIRRAGELLAQVNGQGARTDQLSEGGHTKLTQDQVARDAGLSKHQQVQAVRIANIPREDFERQVDSDKPPTLSQLAVQGIQRPQPRPVVDLNGRDPSEFNLALHYVGGWEMAAKDIAALEHERALTILTPSEINRLRAAIASIDAATDHVITRI